MIKSSIAMKRDMDLIRAMLLTIESDAHGFAPKIEISGYTQEQVNYHAVLLGEAGLAKVHDVTTMGSDSPEAKITRLTWAGHEFLDSARQNQTWNLAKDAIGKIGGASIDVWIAWLTAHIKNSLGL
jgi:hypothetical protein